MGKICFGRCDVSTGLYVDMECAFIEGEIEKQLDAMEKAGIRTGICFARAEGL